MRLSASEELFMHGMESMSPTLPSIEPNLKGTESGQPYPVSDTLCYLEAVKTRFAVDPAVYSSFLEIMKEFKAQR